MDDDEEVRTKSASLASWILSDPALDALEVGNKALSPPAARMQLAAFLVAQYSGSVALCIEVVSRITNAVPEASPSASWSAESLSPNHFYFTPFRVFLQDARKEDTGLFVTESLNLYVNHVAEASRWVKVVMTQSPTIFANPRVANPFAQTLLAELTAWSQDALLLLIESAEVEDEGPLSWTSKPEVFTLGMRAILAAQLVLWWADRVEEGGDGLEVKRLVEKLLDVGVKKGMHPLWVKALRAVQ